MNKDPRFVSMMNGGFARFTQEEMFEIISHLNEFYINTIHIQQFADGTFICIVDRHTVEYYKKEHVNNV